MQQIKYHRNLSMMYSALTLSEQRYAIFEDTNHEELFRRRKRKV